MRLHIKIHQVVCFLILPVLLPFCLSGCISESLEGCPLDVLLQFTYKPDGAATDLFGPRVQRVRLCIYRLDGRIEHTQTLEKGDLDRLQGVELHLPQGSYTAVLWANASDAGTKLGGFSDGETIDNLFASHPQAETSPVIPTLDRLLFAATPLTVSERDVATGRTVNFSPSTMRVSVLLEGVSVNPVVRITGMASALQPKRDEDTGAWKTVSVEQGKTFAPAVTYDATNRRAEATTDLPRFKADTPGRVEIIDPATGNLIIPPISLAELIRKYGIQIGDENEIVIPIEVTFRSGFAKITVKGWENQNVRPGGV